ncbi:MAG: hypothetical protein ABIH21_03890 [Patescibacteria group bacterium]
MPRIIKAILCLCITVFFGFGALVAIADGDYFFGAITAIVAIAIVPIFLITRNDTTTTDDGPPFWAQ